tara:strand:- start:438 stop:560 length:123 start_codon:yes stop_codon:yes gene_type:complete
MIEFSVKVKLEGKDEEGVLEGEFEDCVVEVDLTVGLYRDY